MEKIILGVLFILLCGVLWLCYEIEALHKAQQRLKDRQYPLLP